MITADLCVTLSMCCSRKRTGFLLLTIFFKSCHRIAHRSCFSVSLCAQSLQKFQVFVLYFWTGKSLSWILLLAREKHCQPCQSEVARDHTTSHLSSVEPVSKPSRWYCLKGNASLNMSNSLAEELQRHRSVSRLVFCSVGLKLSNFSITLKSNWNIQL